MKTRIYATPVVKRLKLDNKTDQQQPQITATTFQILNIYEVMVLNNSVDALNLAQ